jgi:hypothetical protein
MSILSKPVVGTPLIFDFRRPKRVFIIRFMRSPLNPPGSPPYPTFPTNFPPDAKVHILNGGRS